MGLVPGDSSLSWSWVSFLGSTTNSRYIGTVLALPGGRTASSEAYLSSPLPAVVQKWLTCGLPDVVGPILAPASMVNGMMGVVIQQHLEDCRFFAFALAEQNLVPSHAASGCLPHTKLMK